MLSDEGQMLEQNKLRCQLPVWSVWYDFGCNYLPSWIFAWWVFQEFWCL